MFLQLLVGHALPSLVLYCLELKSRVHWWLLHHPSGNAAETGGSINSSSSRPAGSDSSAIADLHQGTGTVSVGSSSRAIWQHSSVAPLPGEGRDCCCGPAGAESGAIRAAPSRLPLNTTAAADNSSSSSSSSQHMSRGSNRASLNASAVLRDPFSLDVLAAALPPTFKEGFVVLVCLASAWIALAAVTGWRT